MLMFPRRALLMNKRLFSSALYSTSAPSTYSSCLIDAPTLAEALQDIENPHVLEVGGVHSAIFERARITNARPMPINAYIPANLKHIDDLDARNSTGVRPGAGIIQPPRFEWMMSQLGIKDQNDDIFLYDDAGMLPSARVWWVLNCYGHKNVFVLNGGWKAWLGAVSDPSFPFPMRVDFGPPTNLENIKTNYRAKFDPKNSVLLEEMLSLVGKNDIQIVDARPWEEFIGKNLRGNKFSGHIPDARFFDLAKTMPSGQVLPIDSGAIKEVITSANLKADKHTVVYCHSAIRATAAALILKESGFDNVRVYEGSMSEWNNREDTPKKHWD